ncbi:YycH family regulatory protein [Brevibacillus sedimenti]|jgi:regulatory protein YycH of two-component signal transduction system YycFG|uniref:YycH family regulatory protein n=1 Tax=Brevibacillus sedimenti TaxID=2613334 RepID=UPI001E55AABF|nr:two-component system activity regulator YycH [Anoxybacillus sediminis]UFJ62184.1 transcriptional regulator [Anoxybacillus sediminis]
MKKWKEPAKTVLLNLLVLTSFCLTALLWSNQPKLQFIEPAQYKESKPVREKQLEELVTPESVIFHYGQNRHTKANATDGQYRIIVQMEMPKWIFLDFASYPLTADKWGTIAREKQGVEIRFRSSVPMSVVGRLVTIRDENETRLKSIDRLWLYYEELEDVVYALFISTEEERVMRARTSISPKDLRQSYLPTGNAMPEQIMKMVGPPRNLPAVEQQYALGDMYYLPKNRTRMQAFRYSYHTLTNDQLIDAYFLDRTLVRQIMERDKTLIFTDGSRSIQLRSEQQAITFTDPVFQPSDQELSDEEKVKGAVSFINKHVGWTGDFHFETIKRSYNEKDVITFRQYVGAYPLVSQDGYPIDVIRITSEAGQVVTLDRSLLGLERYIDNHEWIVMSGPEMFQYIRDKQLADTEQITNAYLAYETRTTPDYVELTPIWVVEIANRANLYIPARVQRGGGQVHGLE